MTNFDLSIKKYVNSIANDAQTQAAAVNIGTGTVFTYIVRVTNNGAATVNGTTTVTDPGPAPAGVSVTGVSGTGWTCSRVGNAISCTSTDAILNTQTFPDITIVATTSTATGYFTNTSTVANP